VSIGGTIADGNAGNLNNAMHLGSCALELRGNADFDNIAHTTDADNIVHIAGVGAPQIDNFDPATIVHCHDVTDGATNNAVNNKTTFNTQRLPWNTMMRFF